MQFNPGRNRSMRWQTNPCNTLDSPIQKITSIGFIIINPETNSILCVRSTNTYQCGNLMAGDRWYRGHLTIEFVDKMAAVEKQMILKDTKDSGYPYFLNNLHKIYSKRLKNTSDSNCRFINNSLRDYVLTRDILYNKLKRSETDGPLPWSFPKGRCNHQDFHNYTTAMDYELSIALRETKEETNITPEMLDIKKNIAPYIISYVDMGVQYEFKFYYALPNQSFNFYLDKNNLEQTFEISAIEWLTYDSLACKPLCSITREHILGNFNLIIDHYRRSTEDAIADKAMHDGILPPIIRDSQKRQRGWTPSIRI
jgi:8-oxo-dGTP pyrophosphatase MutT (NUDIX family)